MSSGGSLAKMVSRNQNPGLSGTKQRQDALTRLTNVEARLNRIDEWALNFSKAVQEDMTKVATDMNQVNDALEAIVEILGAGPVGEVMKRQKIDSLENEMTKRQAALDLALVEGRMIAVEIIDTKSCLVVTKQTNAEGVQLYPSKIHLAFAAYEPTIAEKLTGKKVGDVIETDDGMKVEVLGIYLPVHKTDFDKPSTSGLVITGDSVPESEAVKEVS